MADEIFRSANFNMNASSDNINFGTKKLSFSQFRTLCIQLVISNPVAGTDGTFQLLVSNDGVTYRPVEDRAGLTYKAVVSGATITSYFIFVDEPVAGAQYIGLKYTRVGGTGTLRGIYVSGTST